MRDPGPEGGREARRTCARQQSPQRQRPRLQHLAVVQEEDDGAAGLGQHNARHVRPRVRDVPGGRRGGGRRGRTSMDRLSAATRHEASTGAREPCGPVTTETHSMMRHPVRETATQVSEGAAGRRHAAGRALTTRLWLRTRAPCETGGSALSRLLLAAVVAAAAAAAAAPGPARLLCLATPPCQHRRRLCRACTRAGLLRCSYTGLACSETGSR